MAYIKTTWVNGETPINADNLNHIETGIKSNENLINNITGSILWSNSNPTANFSGQQITLSSSDYDVLEIYWRSNESADGFFGDTIKFLKGYGSQMEFGSPFSTSKWIRRIVYVNDTTLNFWDCLGVHDGQYHNDYDVPLYVIGYKIGLFS